MTDDLLDSLETLSDRLDFGEYEAAAYLTILEHGELTASEIADQTDIPQPRVYDTVRDLSDRGLVEVNESRPMKVLAIDPADAFDEYRVSFSTVVEGLTERYTQPARESEGISLVRSRPTILRYIEDILDAAEYELLLSLTPDLLDRYEDLLAAKIDDSVGVEIMISPSVEVPDADAYDYREVATAVRARRGVTSPVIAIADGQYAIYATREGVRGAEDRYGVIFDRSELGFLLSSFLNTVLWSTAETVLSYGEIPTFPRRYATIRRCVSELQSVEGPLYARIEGRDIVTGNPRVLTGKVSETAIDSNRVTASLQVETATETVEVGGQLAALEDIEAHEITIDRDPLD
ncbi:HTH-type sugar sensing transcriptional regulator TrmB [Halococcoides cellulosivorans]|uniref:ArsR family transcriptional regulator n=1 Tax=Halococcoides cellulosivorans TaxID=1679096 RepID=A0A2R4WYF1_9EURY|nr:TrmB family transcriptional regulator [Halococcoides cellulosivorans]AWB26577.1 ArsR family transcriptional regulator [Halococcoides cellulosivorans]